MDPDKEFYIPQEVYDNAAKIVAENEKEEQKWNALFAGEPVPEPWNSLYFQ